MKRLCVALLLGLPPFVSAVTAQGPTIASEDAVDTYVRTEMEKRQIPGLAVAVIREGQVRKLAAYGKASLESGTIVTQDTLFNVASVSKAFTGVAIMRLVEDRVIALDDPIGSQLSELPADWRVVTVRQLLNHTSGLPVIDVDRYSTRTLAQSVPAALSLLGGRPMEFTPGTKWGYNGTNYMLLGILIERLSGKSFIELYGLGWVLNPRPTRPTVGGTGGLRAAFFIYPKDNLSVIVLTNLQAAARIIGGGPRRLIFEGSITTVIFFAILSCARSRRSASSVPRKRRSAYRRACGQA